MSIRYLRRYTDLTSLVYLLAERKITVLDPELWEDKNDSHYLAAYRERAGLASVLALCFTEIAERHHYWQVFGHSSSGVCIQFNRRALLAAVRRRKGLIAKRVEYLRLSDLRSSNLSVHRLPFIKRYAFRDEREFRFVFASATQRRTLDIPIPLSCVDKITLSPWLPAALYPRVKELIRNIAGCDHLRVSRSTLLGNDEWKEFADSAT